MSDRDRRLIRYGAACVAVVAGAICAAALTNALGNTLATVLIGGGLLAIVIFLLRDMGLIETSAKAEPPAAVAQRLGPARAVIAGGRHRLRAPASPGAPLGQRAPPGSDARSAAPAALTVHRGVQPAPGLAWPTARQAVSIFGLRPCRTTNE